MNWLKGDRVDSDQLYSEVLKVLNVPLDILEFDDDTPFMDRPVLMLKLKDWFKRSMKEYAIDGQLILYLLPDTYLDLEGL